MPGNLDVTRKGLAALLLVSKTPQLSIVGIRVQAIPVKPK